MPTDDPDWSAFLEAALVSLLESADEGVLVFDREGRCRMIGRRAGELFGIEPAAHVGKPRLEVLRAIAASCEEPEAFLDLAVANDLLEPPKIVAEVDVRVPLPRTIVWSTFPVVAEGAIRGRLALVRDVTRAKSAERALKQLQERLHEVAPKDRLTGLYNARRFREELEREHGRSTRAWDSYAVLRLDVDGMAALNEQLGEPVGDAVLEQVADCLKRSRREYDVVARFDGDEFAVLLPGADAVGARAVVDRMMKAVSGQAFDLPERRRITLSVGVCVWVPPSPAKGEEILKRAGFALDQAREAGIGKSRIDPGDAARISARPPQVK